MSIPYPQNTIWYVEASQSDGSDPSCGSAVAVWLERIDQPQIHSRYLLTCAHVVRGTVPGSSAQDRDAGHGPLLPCIVVWGPNTGYTAKERISVTLATDIKPVASGVVPSDQRKNVADDWVVLRMADEQASQAMDCVSEWTEATQGVLKVFGYPGGTESFQQSKVIPTSGDDLRYRDLYHGVVRLNGMETRPGMSGGGVFDNRNRLVGIHRARRDESLQCHSVSALLIRDQLKAAGFQPVAPRFVASSGQELNQGQTEDRLSAEVVLDADRAMLDALQAFCGKRITVEDLLHNLVEGLQIPPKYRQIDGFPDLFRHSLWMVIKGQLDRDGLIGVLSERIAPNEAKQLVIKACHSLRRT
jgi:hypothetical protein